MRQTWCRRAVKPSAPVHVILCVADHFEPLTGRASAEAAMRRLECWERDYPQNLGKFRDSDGFPPRHTFFYPIEQYRPSHLEVLGRLCRQGFGEVEVHLHHDGDTPDSLRQRLLDSIALLALEHGQLCRERATGKLSYAFVHGNWALDNSRPDGKWCGVNNELDILRETGCYGDFTMPSAPSPTQTRKINSLYYAVDDPLRPKSHNWGVDAGLGPRPDRSLLLIQGPLLLNWTTRRWGVLPKIENGCLQRGQPATWSRLQLWLRAHVQVPSRPDWYFVKLHTHGAPEANHDVVLGQAMAAFHAALAAEARRNPDFHYHYVTAREMVNLVRAAEAGWQGSLSEARDYELVWNGSREAASRLALSDNADSARVGSR